MASNSTKRTPLIMLMYNINGTRYIISCCCIWWSTFVDWTDVPVLNVYIICIFVSNLFGEYFQPYQNNLVWPICWQISLSSKYFFFLAVPSQWPISIVMNGRPKLALTNSMSGWEAPRTWMGIRLTNSNQPTHSTDYVKQRIQRTHEWFLCISKYMYFSSTSTVTVSSYKYGHLIINLTAI